ncbi:MAG: hypothetical protein HZB99_01695 [Candidatus Harrisonbacteria bacterium]|nr:hypothetical protein [Candidatus Harrisonbacteria bacterium]
MDSGVFFFSDNFRQQGGGMTADAPKEVVYIPRLLLMLVNQDVEIILFSQDLNFPATILAVRQGAKVSLIDRTMDLCVMKDRCGVGPLVRIEPDSDQEPATHEPRFDRKLVNIPAEHLQPHPRYFE